MGTGLLSIGVTGIKAAQLGLLATEHNIVNAGTPGYSRQSTVQATNLSVVSGSGSIGQGVNVVTIKRQYDSYLTSQVNRAQTQVSSLEAQYTQLSQIDIMLADPAAGLSPALQEFFTGVQQVSSNPSSLPARQSMLTSAQTLVSRFSNMESRLAEIGEQLNGRITSAVSDINAYASEIADLNQRIVLSEGAYAQPANDLLDQRDQLINELNKLIKVNTTTNDDGSFNVFIGSGQQLVVGGYVTEMTAEPSSVNNQRIVVGLKTSGGSLELPDSLIVGGELGGLVSFRSQSLDASVNELGRVAVSLALTFNAQYGLGQDLSGRIAGEVGFEGEFFSVPITQPVASVYNSGSSTMTAEFLPPVSPSEPGGAFYTNLTVSDYQVTFQGGGAYTVTRLNDNTVVGNGVGDGTVDFDGIRLNIASAATAVNGDRFVLRPLAEAARNIELDTKILADPRMVNAGAPVRTMPAIDNSGSMTLSQGVVEVGYSVADLPQTLTATATDLTGLAGAWTATYSDGTSVTGPGNIPLVNGAATLAGISRTGMSFRVDGQPAVGDSFVIQRNVDGVQDGRNALLFAKLQTSNTVAGGTATYQTTYARLVADNGIRTREAKVRLGAQEAVLVQAQNARDALSAVNLDEEAANLMKYQQAYQAAAKVLQIGGTLFDTILSIR